jgi:hypothetical protein
MTATYEKIATTTLGSAQASVTFSTISGSYTDLVLVINWGESTSGDNSFLRFNSDTGSNYSNTELYGTGSSAGSQRRSNATFMDINRAIGGDGTNIYSNAIINIQNYSNTTTYKTALLRSNLATGTYPGVDAFVGLWRSTSAITSITILPASNNLLSGSTFTLYGIKAE